MTEYQIKKITPEIKRFVDFSIEESGQIALQELKTKITTDFNVSVTLETIIRVIFCRARQV